MIFCSSRIVINKVPSSWTTTTTTFGWKRRCADSDAWEPYRTMPGDIYLCVLTRFQIQTVQDDVHHYPVVRGWALGLAPSHRSADRLRELGCQTRYCQNIPT